MSPFRPAPSMTKSISVAATSARVALGRQNGPLQVRVMNNGTATVWIKFGDSTIVADGTKDIPVGSGGTEVFTIQSAGGDDLYAAAIAAGSTGSVYFTPGTGI